MPSNIISQQKFQRLRGTALSYISYNSNNILFVIICAVMEQVFTFFSERSPLNLPRNLGACQIRRVRPNFPPYRSFINICSKYVPNATLSAFLSKESWFFALLPIGWASTVSLLCEGGLHRSACQLLKSLLPRCKGCWMIALSLYYSSLK